MGEYQVPNIIVEERLGRWVAEKQWPSPDLVKTTYFLTHERGLTTEHGNVKARTYADFSSPLSTGMDCGRQGYGKDPDFPIDQRHEDANSLTFDSAILGERLEILGTVEVELNLACSTETGFIAVRLCDFDPQNKSSSLVSFGILNLTHMKSHESPERLKPGKMYRDVKVVLNTTAYAFPAGHRIRIAVSTSFWPMVWPSADNTAISLATIYEDGADGVDPTTISRVHFPVRKAPQTLEQLAEDRPRYSGFYRDPRHADATAMTELRPAKLGTRHLLTDVVTGTKKLILTKDYGLYLDEDNGIEHDEWMEETHTIKDPKHVYETPDPLTARTEINYYIEAGRSRAFTERLVEQGRYAGISDKSKVPATDWRFRIETKTAVTSSKTHFRIESELIAYDFKGIGEKRERVEVFRRKWDESVERKLT